MKSKKYIQTAVFFLYPFFILYFENKKLESYVAILCPSVCISDINIVGIGGKSITYTNRQPVSALHQ